MATTDPGVASQLGYLRAAQHPVAATAARGMGLDRSGATPSPRQRGRLARRRPLRSAPGVSPCRPGDHSARLPIPGQALPSRQPRQRRPRPVQAAAGVVPGPLRPGEPRGVRRELRVAAGDALADLRPGHGGRRGRLGPAGPLGHPAALLRLPPPRPGPPRPRGVRPRAPAGLPRGSHQVPRLVPEGKRLAPPPGERDAGDHRERARDRAHRVGAPATPSQPLLRAVE